MRCRMRDLFMHMVRYLSGVMLLCASGLSQAQGGNTTYLCKDENGRSTYTNVREEMAGKKCAAVSREVSVVPVVPAPRSAATTTPAGFPRVDVATQKSRDEGRRKILQNELSAEQQMFKEAQQTLAEQEKLRTGEERNYAKVAERLQPYKDKVDQHQKNIEALQKELTNLK
jgi:septal ring factor EnvC (AmiA/AmiB activator)